MREELEAHLFNRYPLIFAERHDDASTTAMCRGFECDDGWFTLIAALCQRLQAEADCGEEPQVVATQVKEKFGRLRFRTRAASERQRAMIKLVEALSERTCETCGAPASPECASCLRLA